MDEFRGEPAVDRAAVVQLLLALSSAAGAALAATSTDETQERILSIDLNPLIISQGRPIAVDALVEVTADAELRNTAGTAA